MVASFPVAIALIKILQALEFLSLINVKNMPKNVQNILDMVGQGSLVSGIIDPMMGDFWLFEDGREDEEESFIAFGARNLAEVEEKSVENDPSSFKE